MENIETRKELTELQSKIVGLVWNFCSKHCPNAEFFAFDVNGLEESIKFNDKGCSTDSAIVIMDKENNIIEESI
jgi:hypothetical protein